MPSCNRFHFALLAAVVAAAAVTPVSGKESPTKPMLVKAPLPVRLSADGQGVISDGKTYRPIDDSGVFYYDGSAVSGVPMPKVSQPLEKILRRNGFHGLVRCRLVDYVDCSGTSHGYVDDKRTRVLTLGGETYRVTAPTGDLGWFAYYLKCNAVAGRPHLVVCQLINDRERHTTVTMSQHEKEQWAPPYSGEEKYSPASMEGQYAVRCDVGGSVYTGREYACDGKPFNYAAIYYPKTPHAKVTISHRSAEMNADELGGAAVARIWMFELEDPLPPAVDEQPKNGRDLAMYVPHTWFFYLHYGFPSRTEEQRVKSLTEMVRYMKFCGFNQLQFHIINGSDVAGAAWYDSKFYDMNQGNLFKELLPIAEKEGMQFVPIVAPIVCDFNDDPANAPAQPTKRGFTKETAQLDKDGKHYTRGMGRPAPDPLRPETQQHLKDCLKETLDRCAKSPAVPMVGFRVNGKIGVCYVGSETDRCGQDTGFSEWDISQFEKATGMKVERQQPTPYEWMKANAWDKWNDWRCGQTRDFWLSLRDFVQSYRKDLKLLVACDLPSETPGYNIEWVRGEPVRELLRHHGYDPKLFTNDQGISIQRGMMVASDRYFSHYGPPIGMNPWAHKGFNYAPGVAESYVTGEPSSVEFYQNYWEEDPHPDPQYGATMRTATPVAAFNNYYEPAAYSIRKVNVQRIAYMGWERASIGHEHDLRRFARSFRSLPAVDPKPFDGKVEVLKAWGALPKDKIPAGYEKPEPSVLSVNWFDDKLAVVNDSFEHKVIRLTVPRSMAKGASLVDLGAGMPVAVAESAVDEMVFETELEPFDLQVFSIEKQAPPSQNAGTAPSADPVAVKVTIPENGLLAGAREDAQVTVENRSSKTLKNVEARLDLPEGWRASNAAIALGTLKPGGKVSETVKIAVPASALGGVENLGVNLLYKPGDGEPVAKDCAVTTFVGPVVSVSPQQAMVDVRAGEEAELLFDVCNRSADPCDINLSATSPQQAPVSPEAPTLRLAPEETRMVTVKVSTEAGKLGLKQVTLGAKWSDGGSASAEAMVDAVTVAPKCSKPLSADDPASAWEQSSGLKVVPEAWEPCEGAPAGLQTSLRPKTTLTWDDRNLYLCVQLTDPTHHQPKHQGETWQGDSLQFAFDLPRQQGHPEGRRYIETLVALTESGVETWMVKSPNGMDQAKANYGSYNVRRDGNTTVYTAVLPWSGLGLRPEPDTIVGLSLLINDNNGAGRQCIRWAAGIADSKDPAKYYGVKLVR